MYPDQAWLLLCCGHSSLCSLTLSAGGAGEMRQGNGAGPWGCVKCPRSSVQLWHWLGTTRRVTERQNRGAVRRSREDLRFERTYTSCGYNPRGSRPWPTSASS